MPPNIPGTYDILLYTAAELAANAAPSYKLAAHTSGSLGIDYVNHPEEPGTPGRVGTIVFDDLFKGIGGELADNGDRRRYNTNAMGMAVSAPAWTHVPGLALAPGLTTQLTGGPALGFEPVVCSFQWNDNVFFVMQTRVLQIAPLAGTWTVMAGSTLGSGRVYTGQPALFGKYIKVGIETAAADGVSDGFANYNTVTNTWAFEFTAAGRTIASFFLAANGGLYKLLRGKVTPTDATAPEDVWALYFTQSKDAYAEGNYSSIVNDVLSPRATGLAVFGRFILVFNRRGEVQMVGEALPIKSLVQQGLLVENDDLFGHGCRPWGADLIIPSSSGRLFALNLDSLGIRDIGVAPIQGTTGRSAFAAHSTCNYGADLVVGTRGLITGIADMFPALLLLKNYPENVGPRYNPIAQTASVASQEGRVSAMEFVNNSKEIIWIVADGTHSTEIFKTKVADLLGRDPSFPFGGIFQAGALRTADAHGQFPGRKLALGVRGAAAIAASVGSYTLKVFADFSNTPATAGSVSAAGPFYLSGARPVGASFSLGVEFPTRGVGDDWPRLNLPLYLDYMELPRTGDRIKLLIEASSVTRRLAEQSLSKEEILAALRALRDGATRTLEFLGAAGTPAAFTVLIESVTATDANPNLYRDYPGAVAEVFLKVV